MKQKARFCQNPLEPFEDSHQKKETPASFQRVGVSLGKALLRRRKGEFPPPFLLSLLAVPRANFAVVVLVESLRQRAGVTWGKVSIPYRWDNPTANKCICRIYCASYC